MNKQFWVLYLSFFCLISFSLSSQKANISSNDLELSVDDFSGGIQSIINLRDKYHMNWILKSDSTQYPWQTSKLAWGLGYAIVNGDSVCWSNPQTNIIKHNQQNSRYTSKYFDLEIVRKANADGSIFESYRFSNISSQQITFTRTGIYTPFNDNYPDAKTCVESRCNTHIWAGGNASYVYAERMGGEAPHLGLVLTKGSLDSYEIMNRSRNIYPWSLSGSNVRGTIVLNPSPLSLRPGQSCTLSWVLFTANNRTDFFNRAKSVGFVKATAKEYTLEKEQSLQAVFESSQKLKNVQCFLNGRKIPFSQTGNTVKINTVPTTFGEQLLKMEYSGNLSTFIKVNRIPDIEVLMKKRAQFIVSNQQMNDSNDYRYGAYMVYDNETHAIYKNDDKRKSSDTNEGRERVGMGIFLAMYLQKHPDADLQNSLNRYVSFVRNKLQKSDYSVKNSVEGVEKKRVYNYPWVSHLYLEMYKLTNERHYLSDFYNTLHKYFIDSNYHFYAIDVPAQSGLSELKKAGMHAQHNTLLADCITTADNFVKTGLYFPKSEVNFEQSIIAPSVVFLLEMYQITHNQAYLKEGERQLKSLETFAGEQPDYRLNEIGIRHWDGYWFGKRQFWGDVMPHYWSSITSDAYDRYAQITNNPVYHERAQEIVRNNLCQFFEDGRASCAYIFPSGINGRKAAFFDPFANDQDWALVYYLKSINF